MLPDLVTMKANAAVGLLVAAVALLLLVDEHERGVPLFRRNLSAVLALLLAAIGALTLSQYMMGWDLGIDQLLFTEPPSTFGTASPGRMALPTTFVFISLGASLLLLDRRPRLAQTLALFAAILGLLGIVVYIYGEPYRGTTARFTQMALNTALGVAAIALGIVAARPRVGVMPIILSPGVGGIAVRRMLPIVALVPFVVAILHWAGTHSSVYGDSGLGTSFTSVVVPLLMGVILRLGRRLDRADGERQVAEEEVRLLNADLEQNVARRTLELAEANASLAISTERYRFLADSMPQIVWTGKPDGDLDYYNHRWYEYTGMTFMDTQVRGWKPALHPDDVRHAFERWARSVATGEDYEIEYRFRHGLDGSYRWFLGRASAFRDDDGRVVQWVGTSTDIDDFKRAEMALREVGNDLERRVAERTAELVTAKETAERAMALAHDASQLKSQFLSTMSHELRTPMNAIIGYSNLLLDGLDGELSEVQAADIGLIARSADQLLKLINDVLDLSKIEVGRMDLASEPIDLVALVDQIRDLLAPQAAAKEISLVVAFPDGAIEVMGDMVRLHQIVLNLAGNAVKFTEHGCVTITVRAGVSGPEVAVQDTGIGLSMDAKTIIFDEFRQADGSTTRRFGGTGLGLAIARKLARLHGGDIDVVSEEGVGSTFTLRLPGGLGEAPITRAPVVEDARLSSPSVRGTPPGVLVDPSDTALHTTTLDASSRDEVEVIEAAPGEFTADILPFDALRFGAGDGEGEAVILPWRVSDEHVISLPAPGATSASRDHVDITDNLGEKRFTLRQIDGEPLPSVLRRVASQSGCDLLVIDDDRASQLLLQRLLEGSTRAIRFCVDGATALSEIRKARPDLVVLDLLMPDPDGFDILSALRALPETRDLPVVIVTSLDLDPEQLAWLNVHTSAVLQKSTLRADLLLGEIGRLLEATR